MTSRLSTVVHLAKTRGLRVQLTLFDAFGLYRDIRGSKEWAASILSPYKNSSELAFVELQNEINPRDPVAMNWARQLLPALRGDLGNVPITVSTPGAGGLTNLVLLKHALLLTPLDFYDFHFYGSMALAYDTLSKAKAIASPRQLYIGEAGFSTGTVKVSAQLTAQQYLYYSLVDAAARDLQLPPPAVWTMNDFSGTARSSQALGGQNFFGLYTASGAAKPALSEVSQYFSNRATSPIANPSFELQSGAIPAGWIETHPNKGALAWDSTISHSGRASVKIAATRGPNNAQPAWTTIANIGTLNGGDHLQAMVWAEGRNATGMSKIAVAWYGPRNNYISNSTSPALPNGSTTWTHLAVNAAAPAGAVYAVISLQSYANSGSVWFDDVTVNRVRTSAFPSLVP
jgi:hypothetical protein